MDTCFYVIAWTPRPLEFFRFRYVPLSRHVEKWPNKWLEMSRDKMRRDKTRWDEMRQDEKRRDVMKRGETRCNKMRRDWRDVMKRGATRWEEKRRDETRWDEMRQEWEKKRRGEKSRGKMRQYVIRLDEMRQELNYRLDWSPDQRMRHCTMNQTENVNPTTTIK